MRISKRMIGITSICLATSIFLSGCDISLNNLFNKEDSQNTNLANNLMNDYEFEDLKVKKDINSFVSEFNQNITSNLAIKDIQPVHNNIESDLFNKDINISYEYMFKNSLIIHIDTSNNEIHKINLISNNGESIEDFNTIASTIAKVFNNGNSNDIIKNLQLTSLKTEGNLTYTDYGLHGVYVDNNAIIFTTHIKNIKAKDLSIEDLQNEDIDKLKKYVSEFPKLTQTIQTASNNIEMLIQEQKENKIKNEAEWINKMNLNAQFMSQSVEKLKDLNAPESFTELHAMSIATYKNYAVAADIYFNETKDKTSISEINKEQFKEAHNYHMKGISKKPYVEAETLSIMNALSK